MPDPTGHATLDAVLVWVGAVVLLLTMGGFLFRFVRGIVVIVRRFNYFFDDWYGAPGRPGVPPRLGVMERIGGFEDRLTGMEHEMRPNSGQSLRDQVDLANCRLARLLPDGDSHCQHLGEPPPTQPPPDPGQ